MVKNRVQFVLKLGKYKVAEVVGAVIKKSI